MKIESVQIKNIGPYIGDNTFSFDVTDSLRKMILIGGKNGAGKTTLFNAIKICLYGCVAYGFEANNSHYYEEVSKIINTSEKLKKSGDAAVTIRMLFDDGKYNNIYTFDRSWKLSGKRISEKYNLYKI